MLTKIFVDDRKILCSCVNEIELKEMYEEVKEQAGLKSGESTNKDPEAFFFHYEFVGPLEVLYKNRRFILFGAPRELRFYTQEEYAILNED